jgi:serine/threonine-protein kinase
VRGYPIDLEKIVMKALAKTKNERYRTAREFSRALQSLLMRRGLFIASDEVAAYMVSVFSDRIQKREAHLRWAAEVTQTIDIDKMKAMPPSPWHGDDGSIVTFNSEVQPSQPNTARAAPRPAAGMPALHSQPTPIASPAPAPMPVAVHSPPRPAAQPVLSAKSTLRMGAMPVATAPPPAEPPRRGTLPSIDASRSDDPPTLALPRDNPAVSAPQAQTPAPFEDDFDDLGDTIVSDSLPEMDFTGPPRGGAVPAPGPPLGITLTSAASPVAMAAGPRPAPARQPTPPPMPAVMVPQAAPTLPLPPSDDTRSTVANDSHLAYPQPLLRGSMSNEYPSPMHPGHYPHPAYAQHGPADMQRLFAPPIPRDQRTVTAQALKKRIPLWAVAAGSAAMGLVAFAVVVLLLSRGTHPSATAKPAASASASTSVVVVSTPGPFVSARSEFASAVGSSSSQVDNATSPPPAAASASAPAAPPPSATASEQPIPTANIGSLPTAPPPRGASPHTVPISVAAPAPAAAGGSSGTLKVICFPGCDQVVDNGASLGPSPVVRHNASVGSHRIKLVWSDSSKVVSAIVIADQTATVRENHP